MSENVEQNTICSTCQHKPYCTNARNASGSIIYCEEFELEYPATPESQGKVRQISQRYSYEKQEPNGLIGLCSDCRGWRSCTFPKPEGGIWHCEEYE